MGGKNVEATAVVSVDGGLEVGRDVEFDLFDDDDDFAKDVVCGGTYDGN